jgi:hypothetical protein
VSGFQGYLKVTGKKEKNKRRYIHHRGIITTGPHKSIHLSGLWGFDLQQHLVHSGDPESSRENKAWGVSHLSGLKF